MSGVIIHYGVKGMKWGVRKAEYSKKLRDVDESRWEYELARDAYMLEYGPKKSPKRYKTRITKKLTDEAKEYRRQQKETYDKFIKTKEGSRLLKNYKKSLSDWQDFMLDSYKQGIAIFNEWSIKNGDASIVRVKELSRGQKKRIEKAISEHLTTAESLYYFENPAFTIEDAKKMAVAVENSFMESQPYSRIKLD